MEDKSKLWREEAKVDSQAEVKCPSNFTSESASCEHVEIFFAVSAVRDETHWKKDMQRHKQKTPRKLDFPKPYKKNQAEPSRTLQNPTKSRQPGFKAHPSPSVSSLFPKTTPQKTSKHPGWEDLQLLPAVRLVPRRPFHLMQIR